MQRSSLALQTGKLSAALLLSGQPGLPWTCEAQQWEEKRKRAGAATSKTRLGARDAPYHAVGWFAGMCLHLLPVLLGFLHNIFVGHSWEQEGGDRTELQLFNQQKRGREGGFAGIPTLWLRNPRVTDSPTRNIRTWVVREPNTTTEPVQAQAREGTLSSAPAQARRKGKSLVSWAHSDLVFC